MKKYLAAVSGGPDSMALLHKYKKNICAVCHVNYKKRDSATRDQKIVEDFCKQGKIKLFTKIVKKSEYKSAKSNNFQTIARLIRYEFFCSTSKKIKNNNLLVAHNLDDFVETAYMQLKRKSNTLFYGIPKNSIYKNLIISRPLLNKRKKELEQYCLSNNIPYGVDETNLTNVYERNIVRKEIAKWPQTKFNSFVKKINLLNKKNSKTKKLVDSNFNKWKKTNYSTKFFCSLSNEIKTHLIYDLLSSAGIHKTSKDKLTSILKFIGSSNVHTKYRIGDNKYLIKNKNNISIY